MVVVAGEVVVDGATDVVLGVSVVVVVGMATDVVLVFLAEVVVDAGTGVVLVVLMLLIVLVVLVEGIWVLLVVGNIVAVLLVAAADVELVVRVSASPWYGTATKKLRVIVSSFKAEAHGVDCAMFADRNPATRSGGFVAVGLL